MIDHSLPVIEDGIVGVVKRGADAGFRFSPRIIAAYPGSLGFFLGRTITNKLV